MSVERIRKRLHGDSPGSENELNYFRIGPSSAPKKVYLQAALHADEHPGILVLHHLLKLLCDADLAAALRAQFVLMPMVNPLGMGDIEFGRHQGRYNRGNGINYNRGWPVLFDEVGAALAPMLGDDAGANIECARAQLRNWIETLPQATAFDQWRGYVLAEACDADYVFDLHCDNDALVYLYSIPPLDHQMQRLANCIGAAATLLAEDSGGGSFDEVWPAFWLRLARECPHRPLPLPVVSCTIEYRGQIDTFDELNRDDAINLYRYFQNEGLIDGEPMGSETTAPVGTDLRATELIRAPRAGLLAYCVELGNVVKKGDRIADLILLDGEDAFVKRVPLLAGTDGKVISRARDKYVWRNATVAQIVGDEILDDRGDYLLGD